MAKSNNMNYYFNKEYFQGLAVAEENNSISVSLPQDSSGFVERNLNIRNHQFQIQDGSFRPTDIPGVCTFELTTVYPGLLMGTGYAHELKTEDAIKCGFSFDYVSGLPYLPGSSLKGMLRSYFPGDKQEKEVSKNKESYIQAILDKEESVDILKLKENIFDYGDTFLDVFPNKKNRAELLEFEYITPHNKPGDPKKQKYAQFASPNPIKLIKVEPNVTFSFCFLLEDYKDEKGNVIVSKEDKLALFKKIILDMGIGAKTNVGFGKMQEERLPDKSRKKVILSLEANGGEKKKKYSDKPRDTQGKKSGPVRGKSGGVCIQCGKPTSINPKTNKQNSWCRECYNKNNDNSIKKR